MKKPDLGHWILLGVIAALTFYLWLSPWSYHTDGLKFASLVRIHRITGKTERLFSDGWITVGATHESSPSAIKSAKPLTFEDMGLELPK